MKGKGGGGCSCSTPETAVNIKDGVMLLTRPLNANKQMENKYYVFSEYPKESLVD
jgi:hypothetical protein